MWGGDVCLKYAYFYITCSAFNTVFPLFSLRMCSNELMLSLCVVSRYLEEIVAEMGANDAKVA